jgi:hypothetical protein
MIASFSRGFEREWVSNKAVVATYRSRDGNHEQNRQIERVRTGNNQHGDDQENEQGGEPGFHAISPFEFEVLP